MNNQLMFTVHDSKAETFLPPFFVPSRGLAIRAFEDCINSNEHHFGKHPADYTLFSLGFFDTDSGEFVLSDRISIGNGVEFINPLKTASENIDHVPHPSRSSDENG